MPLKLFSFLAFSRCVFPPPVAIWRFLGSTKIWMRNKSLRVLKLFSEEQMSISYLIISLTPYMYLSFFLHLVFLIGFIQVVSCAHKHKVLQLTCFLGWFSFSSILIPSNWVHRERGWCFVEPSLLWNSFHPNLSNCNPVSLKGGGRRNEKISSSSIRLRNDGLSIIVCRLKEHFKNKNDSSEF